MTHDWEEPYLHIVCMQPPAEVIATDGCRVADGGGGRWPVATISVGLSNKEALCGTTSLATFGRILAEIAITRPEFVSSFTCEI